MKKWCKGRKKEVRNRILPMKKQRKEDLQGNGPIRHVETCPVFFSLQEYTQQNPLSKF
jgi:hypothetical protein